MRHSVSESPTLKRYLRAQGHRFTWRVRIPEERYFELLAQVKEQHPEESEEQAHARALYRHVTMNRTPRLTKSVLVSFVSGVMAGVLGSAGAILLFLIRYVR